MLFFDAKLSGLDDEEGDGEPLVWTETCEIKQM